MPTQEERLSALEQTVTDLSNRMRDIHYHETMLLGHVSEQNRDIKEIKASLVVINERLGTLEFRVERLEHRIERLEHRIGTLEQSINSRFEAQDKKLDQIMLLLNTLTAK